jgi:hypothetical protein
MWLLYAPDPSLLIAGPVAGFCRIISPLWVMSYFNISGPKNAGFYHKISLIYRAVTLQRKGA